VQFFDMQPAHTQFVYGELLNAGFLDRQVPDRKGPYCQRA